MMPILTSRRVPHKGRRDVSSPYQGLDYRPDHGIDRHVRPISAAERHNVLSAFEIHFLAQGRLPPANWFSLRFS